jgi:hypothetical protein
MHSPGSKMCYFQILLELNSHLIFSQIRLIFLYFYLLSFLFFCFSYFKKIKTRLTVTLKNGIFVAYPLLTPMHVV